jgi:hypothetical protein
MRQLGQHRRRIIPLAVRNRFTALAPAGAGTGRDDSCGNQAAKDIGLCMEHQPQAADYQKINAKYQSGQAGIDQRAVDDEVDIPQPVTNDSDPARDRDDEDEKRRQEIQDTIDY